MCGIRLISDYVSIMEVLLHLNAIINIIVFKAAEKKYFSRYNLKSLPNEVEI